MSFSRNMTILRQGNDITLVNSVRLDEDGLSDLDKLGKVKHVIRLAAFHGMDDPFYKDRYGCEIWALENTRYFPEFEINCDEAYFAPDHTMNTNTKLSIKNSTLIVISTAEPTEGLLLLSRPEGVVLVSGDALQNFEHADRFFNYFGRIMMKIGGFIKPCNIGPAWYGQVKPDKMELELLLEHKFDHLLPSHGDPVVGQAFRKFEPAISGLKRHAKYI